eukprot:8599416-Alexandrium_andersonii.AAC.1
MRGVVAHRSEPGCRSIDKELPETGMSSGSRSTTSTKRSGASEKRALSNQKRRRHCARGLHGRRGPTIDADARTQSNAEKQ